MLEGYIAADYGWRLYNHFFKTYNEKLWGVPASSISADFAAQRIKGMSLVDALWEPVRAKLFGQRNKAAQVTSLIEEFQYPKYGPGMMWERCRDLVEAQGVEVEMQTKVVAHQPRRRPGRRRSSPSTTAQRRELPADHVISSMPFPHLLRAMDPPVPDEVRARRRRPRLPRLPHRRPRRARGATASPTTGSTSTPPRSRSAASRTSARGRPTWSRTGAPASASSTSCSRATRPGTGPTTSWSSRASASCEVLGLVRPVEGRGRLRGADAQGLPGLRRDLQGQRGSCCAVARGQRPQRAPGRAQRHAQVQQPGPLDVHGHADRREHPRRRQRHLDRQRRGGVPRDRAVGPDAAVGARAGRAPAATPRSSPAAPTAADHPLNAPKS